MTKLQDLHAITPKVFKVVTLAKTYIKAQAVIDKEYNIEDGMELFNELSFEYMEKSNELERNSEIITYLESLSYEEVILIETLMYIGRDVSKTEENDITELVESLFKHLDEGNKNVAIDQMLGKFTLVEYLQQGIEIVGL